MRVGPTISARWTLPLGNRLVWIIRHESWVSDPFAVPMALRTPQSFLSPIPRHAILDGQVSRACSAIISLGSQKSRRRPSSTMLPNVRQVYERQRMDNQSLYMLDNVAPTRAAGAPIHRPCMVRSAFATDRRNEGREGWLLPCFRPLDGDAHALRALRESAHTALISWPVLMTALDSAGFPCVGPTCLAIVCAG